MRDLRASPRPIDFVLVNPRSVTITFFLKDSLGDPGSRVDLLPSVQLEGSESDTLHSLAERAFDIAGFDPLQERSILFVEMPGDGGERRLTPHLDVGVGLDGLIFWRVGSGSINTTIGDVERAAKAGLFHGDPHAFSVDRGGYGDSGVIVQWEELFQFLKELGALSAGVLAIRQAATWLVRFLQRHVGAWRVRHARFPDTFLNSIIRRPQWDASSLAKMLDVPLQDAQELLFALGYEEGQDGIYRYTQDIDRAHLRKRLAEKHFLWDGWHDIKQPETNDDPPG